MDPHRPRPSSSRSQLLTCALLALGCSGATPCIAATASAPRPDDVARADALFRGDPRWRGGDGAYSIALGGDRVLWLFGDTFVDLEADGTRTGSQFVRNTVGLQTGLDPRTARLDFYWRGEHDDFFPPDGERWRWPLHGARVGGRLWIFLMNIAASDDPLGFRTSGWSAAVIDNPDDPPDAWAPRFVATPDLGADVIVGSAVVIDGDQLLAFAVREPGDHGVFLVRFALSSLEAGELGTPIVDDTILFEGATEMSVHRDGVWTQIQTHGFGGSDVRARSADRPEGPWSEPRTIFRPPESDCGELFVYAGKAHPELEGGLWITYAANAWDFATLVNEPDVYWPRFARVE